MVKVGTDLPLKQSGEIDLAVWCAEFHNVHSYCRLQRLIEITQWISENTPETLQMSLELAEAVAELNMDEASVLTALIYRSVRNDSIDGETLDLLVGSEAVGIVKAVAQMATTSLLELSNSAFLEKEQQDQVENVKVMLAALIDDARVAVVKLAERLLALRHAKSYSERRRMRIAQEASAIFSPLAGRLGIWQLKWELDDLALRYTQPDTYQQIAKQLKSKRVERERQVAALTGEVRALLEHHGVDGEVFGRAKNISSIWRKMRNKKVDFDQVYDASAVRIVVSNLAECYAALGIIHNTWPHIPTEFDDYIAVPKENGYRSIHTAVIITAEQVLEIQIRTRKMHEDAELGVCAHWTYKDGSQERPDFSVKMDWLRQVMQWHEELAGTERLSTLLQHRVDLERIYITTPKGHVLDLPVGATVLDFAYRIHSDVGHSCYGALVNRQRKQLYDSLSTGEQVEVLTDIQSLPDRDWMERELGFVRTDRARAKLVAYFRNLPTSQQVSIGRDLFTRRLTMLGLEESLEGSLDLAVAHFAHNDDVGLFAALGSGELSLCECLQLCVGVLQDQKQGILPGIEQSIFPRTLRFKVTGENRDGLLHDITELVGLLGFALSGTTGRVGEQDRTAILTLDIEFSQWLDVIKFVTLTDHIQGVKSIRSIDALMV